MVRTKIAFLLSLSAIALAGVANADTFNNTIQLNDGATMTSSMLLYHYTDPTTGGVQTALDVVGLDLSGNRTFSSHQQAGPVRTSDIYSLIGLLRTPDNATHLVVSFDPFFCDGSVVGSPFSTVFRSWMDRSPTSNTEDNMIIAVLNPGVAANADLLRSFFSAMGDGSVRRLPAVQMQSTVASFSNGAIIGVLNPVPEPASGLLLVAAAPLALLRRRR